jgi:protein O-mannosyl-transferase
MPSPPSRYAEHSLSGWLLAMPALAIVLFYWPSFPGSFQFDDWNVIVNEPSVHSITAWWESMPGIRPLLKLSYALNFVADNEATGFRAVNVLIHASNAALVLWLLNVRGRRAGLTAEQASRTALLAALLFALHPVQTEAVTYISGRSASLAACFCLLSMYCWVRNEESASSRNATLWLGVGCASYLAAAACKETALVLPLALWLYSADRPVRATLRRLAPFLLLSLLLLTFALSLPRYRYLLEFSLETRSLSSNLLTQSRAILYLAGQLIRIDHGNADPQLPVVEHADVPTVLLGLTWFGVLIGALFKIRTAPVGAFAAVWFLLWLAPTNSILPRLDVANDRQLYLALIGPAWWLSMRLLAGSRLPTSIQCAIGAMLIILLAHATLQRNRIYATETTFWEDAATRNPANARASNNLGMAYAIDCRFDDAAAEFERSIALDPRDFRARINLRLLVDGKLPGVDPRRCPSDAD